MTGSLRNDLSKSFLRRLFGRLWTRPASDFGPRRGRQTHVIILDGTMSSIEDGRETNAGLTYKLVREIGSEVSIYYEPGLQWQTWIDVSGVLAGKGINRQIRRTYGYLASRYHEGDRIFLFGYSRGAYAVRSLAGLIERVGLLRADQATERNVRDAFRHYQAREPSAASARFSEKYCRSGVEIEMIGAWDTVKSLGINAPVLWRLSTAHHSFHDHHLSENVKRACHALALNETRVVYRPVLWETDATTLDRTEQVWFRGSHGDIGGQLGGREYARPLSNIPLVYMLERAQDAGLPLPDGWQSRFPQDPHARSIGTWAGWGRLFVTRRRRVVGRDPSERLHYTVGVTSSHLPQLVRVGP
ncbi:DUF2235 domain-containing protein [Sulfitobacter sp. HNIBRBA3233]|uniref:DUF2235 domain-containing protein n=1 Tax=Sulfitobacter marinivivus TaxID=3158558 RepID=UPI0032E03C09